MMKKKDKILYRLKTKYHIDELKNMYESPTSEYIIFEYDDYNKIVSYLDCRELSTIRRAILKNGFLKPYKVIKEIIK